MKASLELTEIGFGTLGGCMYLWVKFMHLAFARMPGESYRKRLVLLLRSCDGLSCVNSLVACSTGQIDGFVEE